LHTILPSGYGGVAQKRNSVVILPKFCHKTLARGDNKMKKKKNKKKKDPE
jgi:hypothetical protein